MTPIQSLHLFFEHPAQSPYTLCCTPNPSQTIWKKNVLVWVCGFHATPHALQIQSQKVRVWLETAESQAAERDFKERAAFYEWFSDLNHIQEDNTPYPGHVLDGFDKLAEGTLDLPAKQSLKLAFYRGLYFYLKSADRFQTFQADLLFLYSAWQWYHLVKEWLNDSARQNDSQWVNEMAGAYQELSQTMQIENLEKSGAFARLVEASPSKSYVKTRDIPERLRLQLIMATPSAGTARNPLIAPEELFAETILWNQHAQAGQALIRLHPVFLASPQAKAVVRQSVETGLKNYDFETALRVANLLQNRRIRLGSAPLWLVLSLGVALILAACTGDASWLGKVGFAPFAKIWPAYLISWSGIGLILGLLLICFDPRLLVRLLLPRLLGGVCVGFSALVIQSDPILLSNALWRGSGWLGVAGLWLAVLTISFLYGYSDIRPRVKEEREVRRRATQSMVVFTLFTLVIGLFILSFPSAAFYDQLLQPDWMMLGPAGWVSIRLWLTFSPLALFLGIVTQFLFEDKTVTASVWPVEKE